MKRKQIVALLLAAVLLLLCLTGCSGSDYLLSQSQLDEKLAAAREDGYNEGLEDGRSEAEDEHHNDYDAGYNDGYERGRADTEDEYKHLAEDSYENGYEEGVSAGASFDVDSVWKEGYDYGYNSGIASSGTAVTSPSVSESQSEPTTPIAMLQPETQPAPAVEQTPQQETSPTAATYDYIINTNTGKFHYTWCKSVSKMAEKNKWYYNGTRDSVVAMGYVPCKNCNP